MKNVFKWNYSVLLIHQAKLKGSKFLLLSLIRGIWESVSQFLYHLILPYSIGRIKWKTANKTKNCCHYDICIDYLLEGSTLIELGWVKCLKRVLCFFPFISILFTSPFSPLVQYTLFQIQSTARPEMCLSYEYSFCKRSIHN